MSGRVLDDDGQTPLKARVAVSGDRIVSAGGIVGTGFAYVRNYQIADTDLSGQFSFGGLFVGEFALSAVGEFSPDPVTLSGFDSVVTSTSADSPNSASMACSTDTRSAGGSSVGVPPPKKTVDTGAATSPSTRPASRTSAIAACAYVARDAPGASPSSAAV